MIAIGQASAVTGEILGTAIRHLVRAPSGELVEVTVRFYEPDEWDLLPPDERSAWSAFRLASGLVQAVRVLF